MRDLAPQLSIGTAQSQQEHADGRAPGRRSLTETLVRRQARDARGVAGDAPEALERAAGSGGVTLPEGLASQLAAGFGADLGAVRLHTGEASSQAADALGARAFAVGQDIHFGAGEFDPSSQGGQRLIAHEVAHTLQQGAGAAPQLKSLEVSQPGDHAEAEADLAADRVLAGETGVAAALGGGSPRIQRAVTGSLRGLGSSVGDQSRVHLRMADVVNWVNGQALCRDSFAGGLDVGREMPVEIALDAGSTGALRLDLQGDAFQDNLMLPSSSEYNHILRWDYTVTPQGDITSLTPRPQEIHDGDNSISLTTPTQEDPGRGLVRIALTFSTSGTGAGGSVTAGPVPVGVNSPTGNRSGGHTFLMAIRLVVRNRQPTPARPTAPQLPARISVMPLFSTGRDHLSDEGMRSLNRWALQLQDHPHLLEAVRHRMVPIHIIGRASELGTVSANMGYAQGRVDAVMAVLAGSIGRQSGLRTGGLLGNSLDFDTVLVGAFGAGLGINNPIDRNALVFIDGPEAQRGITRWLEQQQRDGDGQGSAAPGGRDGR